MRKLIVVTLLLTGALAFGQFKTRTMQENLQKMENRRFGWGFWLGGNNFSFDLDVARNSGGVILGRDNVPRIDDEPGGGFSVGLMGSMRVYKYVDLVFEPGMHFVSRKLFFYDELLSDDERERTIQSTYVDFPIFVKLHGVRWGNTRPYIKAGVGYAYNAQSNEDSDDDSFDGTVRMTTHNFNWQGEMGVEIFFNRFKLTPSIKGIFFLNDEIVADDPSNSPLNRYANGIDGMRTRAVVFSLKFQ